MDTLTLISDMESNELQAKGQIQKANSLSQKVKRTTHEGLFMGVSKKAEKIATALYMLSDLMPENDPMRQRVRQLSLSILADTRGLSYSLTGDLYFQLAKIVSTAWELMSLLEVAVVVGFVSDMNYAVMKHAVVEFISDIRNRQRVEGFQKIQDMKIGEGEASHFELKSEFFKVDDEELGVSSLETAHQIPVGPAKEKPIIKRTFVKDINKRTSENSAPDAQTRKEKILDLIKEKKNISIKDIIFHFKEYSQKTIQRDMTALVEEGKIRREGNKRWSRYSLV